MENKKLWKIFYAVTGFLGLVLIFFEIFIYRKTIIRTYIPISIILVVGLITFYFNKNHYKQTYSLTGNFYPIIQNICSWGFITCYIFMATNFYLAENKTFDLNFKIKEKSSMPGPKNHREEREPLVRFDYYDLEKELVFNYEDTEKVKSADSVKIFIRKGYFGFDILDKYEVNNKKE